MKRYLQDSTIMRERYGLGRQGDTETGIYYVRDINVINAVESRVRGLIRQFCEEMRAAGRFSSKPLPALVKAAEPVA